MRRSFIIQFFVYALLVGTLGTISGLILGSVLGSTSITSLFIWGFLGAIVGIGAGGTLGAYLSTHKRERQQQGWTAEGQERRDAEQRWLPRWVELVAALISMLVCVGLMLIILGS